MRVAGEGECHDAMFYAKATHLGARSESAVCVQQDSELHTFGRGHDACERHRRERHGSHVQRGNVESERG